ncbi:cell division protein FtsA [Clostridium weizhouense]|uniref:Rod shape-determining protein n=1 Tax=Clostridium weizhouense TaxID=2859781 RepID=A0ABS7AN97_9CLOT|nr:cell division FtsA domain-containing protein [Clostridium weizhouense]MBW6409156.1 rod shape-determining protein [Clostridium weizhouense]
MELRNFNPKDIIFSLDIGTRSIIGTVGLIRDKKFEVVCEEYMEHEERAMVDGQIHDINLVASVVEKIKRKIEEKIEITLKEVSIAAAGRFLRTVNSKAEIEIDEEQEIDNEIVRSLELSAVKNAEEEINNSTEGKLYCVGYSVKSYYLNGFIISNLIGHKGQTLQADVIATFLPRSVVDSLYAVMNKVNLKVTNLTLEPIAAIEAAIPKNLRLLNIALVDIGAGTSDIAISYKETISAYGMVPMAGDEVTEVIAQEYLVDFNTAEFIKRAVNESEEIKYVDVLGLENVISSESVTKLVKPIVKKISEEISSKILELNGNKPPSAVFLVGGGAHTPELLNSISTNLNLPSQRIAIKDRKAIPECVADNNLGSAGVTVIGIGLIALRNLGTDFIDVILNDTPISLFNSHKHTVMDALLQARIDPNLLIARNGKSIRFKYNGRKRIVFGEYGTNAKVTINQQEATLETEVKANDNIVIEYAKNGNDAKPKISEHINNINSISIYIDDELVNLDPIILVNNKEKDIDDFISNNDELNVFIPNKIKDIKKYILNEMNIDILKDNRLLDDDYEVSEGNILNKFKKSELKDNDNDNVDEYNNLKELYNKDVNENISTSIELENIEELKSNYNELEIAIDNDEEMDSEKIQQPNFKEKFNEIKIVVNNEEVVLKGKNEYIFVDIFDYIDFDLTVSKGNINAKLNGENSSYTAKLKEGDVIELFWSK